jgi:AraC-like DNA-binding protein
MQGWDGVLASSGLAMDLLPGDCAAVDVTSMRLAEFVRFSESVMTRTRSVAIPWLAGMHYDLGLLGTVGDAINSAGRVGLSLRRFVDYFSLLQDCTDISLERDGSVATVSYRILDPEIWPRHGDAMFTLGIVAQIIRRGGAWERVECAFEAEQSEIHGDVSRLVQAPCTFGADTNQIRFPAALLDLALPLSGCGSDIRDLNRRMVAQRRATPVADRLALSVYRDLNSRVIDQERIAREIGMSSRTMRRKLADEGSSYQQVLDECRMRQAAFEFRTRPDMSIAQIALRLGYAEHSNFTRAFHRWSGLSPQAYRTGLGH